MGQRCQRRPDVLPSWRNHNFQNLTAAAGGDIIIQGMLHFIERQGASKTVKRDRSARKLSWGRNKTKSLILLQTLPDALVGYSIHSFPYPCIWSIAIDSSQLLNDVDPSLIETQRNYGIQQ